MCVYVCIYVYVYVCMYVCIYMYTHIYTYIHTYIGGPLSRLLAHVGSKFFTTKFFYYYGNLLHTYIGGPLSRVLAHVGRVSSTSDDCQDLPNNGRHLVVVGKDSPGKFQSSKFP